ncbi:MAG: phage recombination protein Bet [Ketobacter sp.]|nr:phage recombination protein Bet [Ketobacter sp.]
MSDSLTTVNANSTLISFDASKIALIKNTVAKNADDNQLALFLHQATRTGLDPLAKQIHCVMRWNKDARRYDMSIQTAIDGYRLIADRTGRYAGNDAPLFDDSLTEYQHLKANNGKPPMVATATIYKIVAGQRVPFTASAAWEAYAPKGKQAFMWRKMPHLMLGKCAEALALRKSFPAELSGVYVREEMEQAGFVEGDTPPSESPPPVANFSVEVWYTQVIKLIDRYKGKDHVISTMKLLGLGYPQNSEEGKAYGKMLRRYANMRDEGVEQEDAIDAIVNLTPPLFEEEIKPKPKGAHDE